jgi:hypothetical protein
MKKIIVYSLLALLGGCDFLSKDEPKTELEKLPPATQEGKNTFGCLLNGKAWVIESSIGADAIAQQGLLSVAAESRFEGSQSFAMYVNDPISIGIEYSLVELSNSRVGFTWIKKNNDVCDYSEIDTVSGYILITKFDKANLIVSGIFEFTTETIDCEKLTVTDGRFDLSLII